MRINKLDLAKTISDFLFLWIDNPEEKAKKLFELKHSLDKRGHGFEKYMQYYFQNFKKYDVKLNGTTWQQDKWIDLLWVKNINWVQKKIIVQCKKHCVKDITLNDVSHFYGKIIDEYNEDKLNTDVYYITTTKFTRNAFEFLESKWVHAIDFSKISKVLDIYPLDRFKADLYDKEWEKEISLSFEKQQIILDFDDNIINTIDANNSEVLQLLKQIRRDICSENQLRLWNIARNDTLELLAKIRPSNFDTLKKSTSHLSRRERNKLEKYWPVFVSRLKYLRKEEEKQKSRV